MKKKSVLIVEDEIKIANVLADYLENVEIEATCVHHGDQVMEEMKNQAFDLVLLDIMLPGKDGWTLCKEIRKTSYVPIIIITARVEEIDRLLGLEIGADDYLCKPFSPREVVARVKAIFRRVDYNYHQDFSQAVLSIDKDKYLAKYGNDELELTPVEFRILNAFAVEPDRVFSRSQLLNLAYDDYRVVSDRTIDTHIKNLRKKLSNVAPDRDWIDSIYGVGYRFSSLS